jgi:T5SS/PEP-CTERM-associated repeat protein/autotransporter-associated beta strand protein
MSFSLNASLADRALPRALALLLCTSTLCAPSALLAGAPSWTGTNSKDWHDPGNWSGGTAPAAGDDVTILTNLPNTAELGNGTAAISALKIADGGTAQATVDGGAHLTIGGNALVGNNNGYGLLIASGAGSFIAASSINVANGGQGELRVLAGAQVSGANGQLGEGGSAQATVDGAGSQWSNSSLLLVGDTGAATLIISNGGMVQDAIASIGNTNLGSGSATVSGVGSSWQTSGAFNIGGAGNGTLAVANGAGVAAGSTILAGAAGMSGSLSVTGPGSTFSGSQDLIVGAAGTGNLALDNQGSVSIANDLVVSQAATSSGTVVLTNGSTLAVGGQLKLATGASAGLGIAGGSTLTAQNSLVGTSGTVIGLVTIDGAGSQWITTHMLTLGDQANGAIYVANGGTIRAQTAILGNAASAQGVGIVDGAGSVLHTTGNMTLGLAGTGELILSRGGALVADGGGGSGAGTILLAGNAGSTGLIEIGAHQGNVAAAPGIVNAATVQFGAGSGTLLFNHTSSNYGFAPALDSTGTIRQLAGVTHLTGDSTNFVGLVSVDGGALYVDNHLAGGSIGGGTVQVNNGATLGGSGSIGSPVVVNSGGTLSGTQGQTLSTYNLALDPNSRIAATLGAPGSQALFSVSNHLTLDGTIDISGTGGFGAGVYRLFDYGSVLTNNGLAIGSVTVGSGSDYSVQTSVANQVNLIYAPSSPAPPPPANLSFWDGSAAGAANDGKIEGGNGTWSAISATFTDANGGSNGPLTPQPGFAIFEGAPGQVAVDTSAGAIAVTGMQFAADGYRLSGGDIQLASPQTALRVGDGTAAGAAYKTIIASNLTGTGGLDKTDLGTLVLTGSNNYSGGTTIEAGQLRIGSGGTSGAIMGDVAVADGASIAFERSDAMRFDAVVSGAGSLIQAGSATLTLGAAQTYAGITDIQSGTLALADKGDVGASALIHDLGTFDISALAHGTAIRALSGNGVVQLGGNTLTISGGGSFDGIIGGRGGLTIGGGTMALTGANSYVGGTAIAAGATLQLGNGGAGGAVVGDIADDGLLRLNRSDALTLAGAISGSGALVQQGSGVTTLAGANSYSGGTFVQAGTLAGTTTSLQGAIRNDGALLFDQPDAGRFAGQISGAGSVTKAGAGTLGIVSSQSYSGQTTILAGGLVLIGGLPNSDVVVEGGFLGGYGPVKSLTVNGGTLSPGQSPGTMIVTGDATLGQNSIYAAEITASGISDKLAVGGKLTLGGGSLVISGTPGPAGTSYQIVSADGGITGTFGAVTTPGSTTPFILPRLRYTGKAIALDIDLNATAVRAAARTPNQHAAASGLLDLPLSNGVVQAVSLLDGASAPAAFDRLSGEIHASWLGALIEDRRLDQTALLDRLDVAQEGLWAEGRAGARTIGGDGNAAGVDGRVRMINAGFDLPVGDGVLGVTAGYGWTHAMVSDRASSAIAEGWHAGLYGKLGGASGFGLRGAATYAGWHADISRTATIGSFGDTLSSRDHAHLIEASGELDWHPAASHSASSHPVRVGPFLGFDWTRLQAHDFREKGGAAALTGASRSFSGGVTRIGLRVDGQAMSGRMTITPTASLAWDHRVGDRTTITDVGFLGSGSGQAYRIAAPALARDRATAAVGVEARSDRLSAGVAAGAAYGGGYGAISGKIHIAWRF